MSTVSGVLAVLCLQLVSSASLQLWGESNFSSFLVGNSPLIVVSPHGGYLKPESIPNRKDGCWNGTHCLWTAAHGCFGNSSRDSANCGAKTSADGRSLEFAQCLAESAVMSIWNPNDASERIQMRPHLVANQLHRSKLDSNREKGEAAQGNSEALNAWNEIHWQWMDWAKANAMCAKAGNCQALDTCGCDFAVVVEIHGQGFNAYNQMGYKLSEDRLSKTDEELDADTFANDFTSLHSILLRNDSNRLSQIVRGTFSMGTLLNDSGWLMVPSSKQPQPATGSRYFSGGFDLTTHSQRNVEPQLEMNEGIAAFQIEITSEIRYNRTLRNALCEDFSAALIAFVDHWYDLEQCDCAQFHVHDNDDSAFAIQPMHTVICVLCMLMVANKII